MKKVLVTGSKGQLGQSFAGLVKNLEQLKCVFTDTDELDITNAEAVNRIFLEEKPDYCINCAAYTQVDQAENDADRCFEINAKGPENLAKAAAANDCILIHISTDFVFDGKKKSPYSTSDLPEPLNVYGRSKFESEQRVAQNLKRFFVVRTSWVYSEYGHNFVKTMLRLSQEKDEIFVVDDQIGSPTFAGDLAEFLLTLVLKDCRDYGLYHFCNRGAISWFDFASEIFRLQNSTCAVRPIPSAKYQTAAKRPPYSVLDVSKTEKLLAAELPEWKTSLSRCLKKMAK